MAATPPSIKKRSVARAELKLASALEASLAAGEKDRKEEEITYVTDAMTNDETGQLASSIAKMIRNGTLLKAAGLAQDTTAKQSTLGKEIPVGTLRYKNLSMGVLQSLLKTWEPGVFNADFFNNESAPTLAGLRDLVKFGLGLPEDAKLPVHVASLRFENGLAHYTKARYDFLGKRLSDHKVGEGVAYYGMRGEDIVVCVPLQGVGRAMRATLKLAHVGNGDGWQFLGNLSSDAKLVQDDVGDVIVLKKKFAPVMPAGASLFAESDDWVADNLEVPNRWVTDKLPEGVVCEFAEAKEKLSNKKRGREQKKQGSDTTEGVCPKQKKTLQKPGGSGKISI